MVDNPLLCIKEELAFLNNFYFKYFSFIIYDMILLVMDWRTRINLIEGNTI